MNQEQAMQVLKSYPLVYLTGAPGSGKTFLLKDYIKFLKNHGVHVGVTASTGIAATHLNGKTIHSWSGIGVKDELGEEDIQRILKKDYLEHLKDVQVLIIDEVSMLHARQLDMVDEVMKSFKGNHFEPFGGIQEFLMGTFFRFPPLRKEEVVKFVMNPMFGKTMTSK